jgi:hypothetical protein
MLCSCPFSLMKKDQKIKAVKKIDGGLHHTHGLEFSNDLGFVPRPQTREFPSHRTQSPRHFLEGQSVKNALDILRNLIMHVCA